MQCNDPFKRICDNKEVEDFMYNFENRIMDVDELARKLNIPEFHDKFRSFFGKDKKPVEGHASEKFEGLKRCQDLYRTLVDYRSAIDMLIGNVNDLALDFRNSLALPYDSEMFAKGWLYMAKFICKSNHWSIAGAKEEMKADYDGCVELFKKLTAGFETHNFGIGCHADNSYAYFSFTIAGTPGDFEINFPLVKVENRDVDNSDIRGDCPSASIGLTWRRHWVIPHYDYFFDDWGTYNLEDVNGRLKEFVEKKEWKKFYSLEGGKDRDGNDVKYSDEQKSYLQRLLDEEIATCGKEGKKLW